jgi:hypothetical protein
VKKTETPTFAGKPLELRADGAGWHMKNERVEVHASYSLQYNSWSARVYVNGRQLASADHGRTAEAATREAESNMRQTIHLMNSAVDW